MIDDNVSKKGNRVELAKKRFYNFEGSSAVFDSISPFWFVSSESNKNLTRLSAYKVFSDFTFSYLQFLSKIVEKKLSIKNISSEDLLFNDELDAYKKKIDSVLDNAFIAWVNNNCIPTLTELVKRLNVTSYGDLAKLANLLQGEIRFIANSFEDEQEDDSLAYDVFYKIIDRISSYGYLSFLDRAIFDQKIRVEIDGGSVLRSVSYYKDVLVKENMETTVQFALLSEIKIRQFEKQPLQIEK